MPAFVQSHPDSQARLMFVITLGISDCPKINTDSKKFTAFLGGAHSREEESTASPTSLPYVGKIKSRLCSTHTTTVQLSCVLPMIVYSSWLTSTRPELT